ncbi:MAG: diacylglycerol kinase family lipid kinase [Chloroflexota bacterium]
MPRMQIILNPAADHGHARQVGSDLRALIEGGAEVAAAQNGHRYELDWVLTEAPGHATSLAYEASQQGYDAVVAVGGDGTIHEMVNGLMQAEDGQRPRLGVIPAGSGNDFAANLGFTANPKEALSSVFGSQTRLIDVGRIKDETGRQEYWQNTIGIGFSGAVNIATRHLQRWRGFMMYLMAVLETIAYHPDSLQTKLHIDDNHPWETAISMLSLCNGPREGGGFPVAPDAVMDDGLLTYTTMGKMNRLQMLRFIPVVMTGKHLEKHPDHFTGGTFKRLMIESDLPLAIHTDGEVYGSWEMGIRRIEASVVPGALEVLSDRQPA